MSRGEKRKDAPTRDGWRKVGKRIRKCRKKIEKPKENTRDNEEQWGESAGTKEEE